MDAPEGQSVGDGDAGLTENAANGIALQLAASTGARERNSSAVAAPYVVSGAVAHAAPTEMKEGLLCLMCRSGRDTGHKVRRPQAGDYKQAGTKNG